MYTLSLNQLPTACYELSSTFRCMSICMSMCMSYLTSQVMRQPANRQEEGWPLWHSWEKKMSVVIFTQTIFLSSMCVLFSDREWN